MARVCDRYSDFGAITAITAITAQWDPAGGEVDIFKKFIFRKIGYISYPSSTLAKMAWDLFAF